MSNYKRSTALVILDPPLHMLELNTSSTAEQV